MKYLKVWPQVSGTSSLGNKLHEQPEPRMKLLNAQEFADTFDKNATYYHLVPLGHVAIDSAIEERKVELSLVEKECEHDFVSQWDHRLCRHCSAVRIGDSPLDKKDWGPAWGKTFKNMAAAEHYKVTGRYPK